MTDPNKIAEEMVSESFRDHFERARDATQSSAALQQDVYAASQIVCVKKHRKGEECICNNTNNIDRLVVRNNVLPIKKRKRKADEKEDNDTLDSPFCVPVEEHVYVSALKTRSASKNLYCCVYILQSETAPNRTYCGVTNNRARRIRQHNGDIVGGAKQTRSGQPWAMVALLNGFKDLAEAQRFEWSMHHPRARRLKRPHYGVEGRMNCIQQLLRQEAWNERYGCAPVTLLVDGIEIEGTPKENKAFLLGLENSCEIHYAPRQLRLYRSNGGCLANKTLCELEMDYCLNACE